MTWNTAQDLSKVEDNALDFPSFRWCRENTELCGELECEVGHDQSRSENTLSHMHVDTHTHTVLYIRTHNKMTETSEWRAGGAHGISSRFHRRGRGRGVEENKKRQRAQREGDGLDSLTDPVPVNLWTSDITSSAFNPNTTESAIPQPVFTHLTDRNFSLQWVSDTLRWHSEWWACLCTVALLLTPPFFAFGGKSHCLGYVSFNTPTELCSDN